MVQRFLLLARPDRQALRKALEPHLALNLDVLESLPFYQAERARRAETSGESSTFDVLDYVSERVDYAFAIELHPEREEYFRSIDHARRVKERRFQQLEGMEDYLRHELMRHENASCRLRGAESYVSFEVREANLKRRTRKFEELTLLQEYISGEKHHAEREFDALVTYHKGFNDSGRNPAMFRLCVRLLYLYRELFGYSDDQKAVHGRSKGKGTAGGFVGDILDSMSTDPEPDRPEAEVDRVRAPDPTDLFKHYLRSADKICMSGDFHRFRDLDG